MRSIYLAFSIFVISFTFFSFGNIFHTSATSTTNSPPNAVDNSYSVHDGIFLSAPGVLGNDSDPDGDTMTVITGSFTTSKGGGYFYPTGGVQFYPNAPVEDATVTATYTVCDTSSACSNATVTFNIHNSAPSIGAKSYTFHGGMDTAYDGRPSLLTGASDSDGDGIAVQYKGFSCSIGGGALYGNGRVQFVTNNGSQDSCATAYDVCDGLGLCSTAIVTFNAYNTYPIAGTDYYFARGGYVETAYDGQAKTTANDSDPDGDSLAVSTGGFGDALGSGYFWATGRVTYYAGYGFSGVDERLYTIQDTFGATSLGTALFFVYPDGMENAGYSCPEVAQPVNVTNGNMWVQQPDYKLPGIGENIEINRFYNSMSTRSGLFGLGWTTVYDQSVAVFGDNLVRLNAPDGKAVYFVRTNTSDPFVNVTSDVRGQIVKNTDNTYTLTFKDGKSQKFGTDGGLLWLKDRNGNQTTLTYTSGVLSSVTDAVGRTLTFTTNGSGKVTEIADSTGTAADYEYYTSTDKLKTVTFPDGSKYKFEYTTISGRAYLTTVKDALDNILETHAYDSYGRATTSEKEGGVEKYEFDYSDASGSTPYTSVIHKKQTSDDPIETKYYFKDNTARNVVTKIEGVCGCGGGGSEVTQFFYDSKLNLVKKTDALSNDTTYTYDSDSNLTSVTDVLGTQSFTYNSLGEILTHTDRMSGVTTNTYSTEGNLLTSTDPLSHTTTLTYTSIGRIATIQNARGKTTTLTYDSAGRLIQITDANGKDTDLAYNARAQVTSVTNALSQVTAFEYDDNNRLNKITYPDTNEVDIAYDPAGRKTSVTDELGHTTTYAYDGAYRLTSITDALSHATGFTYDLMSNTTSRTDALGNVTDFEYDDFDRMTKVKYPIPASGVARLEENFTYDQLGKVKTWADTAGHTTSYDYDSAKRLTKITDALSHETQFTYNARSQTTKVKDALNQEYTFTYDARGRVLTQTRNGTTTTFDYDAVGNRTSRTDYNGNVSSYIYDDVDRLTDISYTGSSDYAAYEYDDVSRLISAENQNGTIALTYNDRGRLASETDVFGHELEYTYNAAGNRTGVELDSGALTSYAYDDANRLATLTDEASSDFTFAYDNANRLTSRVMPNGVTSTYTYDGMGRLKRLKHENGSSTLYDDQYTYNSANQIGEIVGLSQTRDYTYDDIDRLTAETDGTTSESYTYDAVGNRTASHLSGGYTTGSFNRVTATSSASYSYNSNGSTTGKTVGSAGWTYGWDRENRMVSATDGTNSVSYAYDALGRRVKRTQGSDVQKYTHDGNDIVLDDINSTLTKYQNAPGIDNKLKYVTGGTSKYFLQDHLGSTAGIVDSGGSLTDSNSYDSFGNASNGSFTSRYQFTGRENDPLTGLQFNRARFYDQNLGRFTSEDPIGFGGGINMYAYVGNHPTMFIDPTGLFPSIWPFDYHQIQTAYGLQGRAPRDQIRALAQANGDFDARTQDPIYAPYHAMRRPGQSVEEARAEANEFVRNKICLARRLEAEGNVDDALRALGAAIHTLQDARAPGHAGFPEAWTDAPYGVGIALHLDHYIVEALLPGPGADQAEADTLRAWKYYRGAPMPRNFF
jgi:RHS repeat-associated protein